jgi:hypothetical protein
MNKDYDRAPVERDVRPWVVEFDCDEAVIRTGDSPESVNQPDDLGCLAIRIRPLDEVKIKPFTWNKNGCLRCEIA